MRLALIAEHYPPIRSSCAVQMRDLAVELVRQGHSVTFLVPSPGQKEPWRRTEENGVEVLRLAAFASRDMSYVRRVAGELFTPLRMLRAFRASPAASHRFDGVVWYSPNVFFGPLVRALKRASGCPSYLILRDIFPQWAADIGLISRGPAFAFLSAAADYQYRSADVIGVQTPGNLPFCRGSKACRNAKLEVLHNWLAEPVENDCPIDLARSPLAGRKVFVYAGNMGVAQGMDKMLSLAVALRERSDIGFLFVGRGSDVPRMRRIASEKNLANVMFHDEIEPSAIPALYAQCHAGLVALDARHTWHNIPGKFITYMHSGLPVLASVNPGNDLVEIVRQNRVGRISTDASGADLAELALEMLGEEMADPATGERCRALARRQFSATSAAGQIVQGLRERAGGEQ